MQAAAAAEEKKKKQSGTEQERGCHRFKLLGTGGGEYLAVAVREGGGEGHTNVKNMTRVSLSSPGAKKKPIRLHASLAGHDLPADHLWLLTTWYRDSAGFALRGQIQNQGARATVVPIVQIIVRVLPGNTSLLVSRSFTCHGRELMIHLP